MIYENLFSQSEFPYQETKVSREKPKYMGERHFTSPSCAPIWYMYSQCYKTEEGKEKSVDFVSVCIYEPEYINFSLC